MGAGTCAVVNDTPENLETIGDAGIAYDGAAGAPALREVLRELLRDPQRAAEHARRGRERVRLHYYWDAVTDAYEGLFRELIAGPPRRRLA
jgi:glycosyltransferase involved in cell wall biosynthesis